MSVALFVAGISMGIAGAFLWAWGVRSGQLRDLEATKDQLFWPDLAPEEPEASDRRGGGTDGRSNQG